MYVYTRSVHTLLSNSRAPACPRCPQPPLLKHRAKNPPEDPHICFPLPRPEPEHKHQNWGSGPTATTPLRVVPSCREDQTCQTPVPQPEKTKPTAETQVYRIQARVLPSWQNQTRCTESRVLRIMWGKAPGSGLFHKRILSTINSPTGLESSPCRR